MHHEATSTRHTARATNLPAHSSPRHRVHASALPLLYTMAATLALAIVVIVLAAGNIATLPEVSTLL